jgi:heme exporter protein A
MISNTQLINSPQDNIPQIKIDAFNLKKDFDRKNIFRGVNFNLNNKDSLAITGKNGSGKSTLIKILANVFSQSSGEIKLLINGKSVEKRDYFKYIGFVSPYLNLYDEFTGYENLNFITKIRRISESNIAVVLKRVGLWERRNDPVKIYSSGMKQRLKIAFSILHNPPILLFDEPTSNLDAEGIKLVNDIANEQKQNSILVIATNDEHERSLCEKEINLNKGGESMK